MSLANRIFLLLLLISQSASVSVAQNHPILGKFSISENNGDVYLSWSIIAGSSCNGIQIYRSIDSINFSQIGDIPGVCGSVDFTQTYDFTDNNPVKNKVNYYRLELGNQDFSQIVSIEIIDISSLKQGSKAGIIYGFKDWQNYNFFVITNSTFFVGTVFEGLSAMRAEDMYAGNILKSGYNNLKILNIDDKCVFSINGEVQLNTDSYRLYGSKVGFIVSGTNKIIVDKLITKEVDFKGSNNNASNSAEDQNVKGTGSGLIVSKTGYIVTNYHVIDEAKSIVVETRHEGVVKSYNAVVIKSDKDNDISILKIDDKNFTNFSRIQYAFKETGALEVGTSVYTIGFPLALTGMGKEAKFTDGKISAKTGYNNAINSFQTTVPVQPGNSGGPLFDDKGKLIGLVNAKIQEADNVSYAIKLNYLKNLIEVLPETIDLPNDYSINTLPLQEQVKVLSNYVVLIKIK